MSCGCHTAECTCDEGLHGLAVVDWPGLGYIGIDARAQATIAASGSAGRVVSQSGGSIYVPGTADCAASGVSGGARDVQLAGQAGSLALTAVTVPWGGAGTALLATGPATFGITIAIAGLVGIFSTLFAHHAAAVKKEQSTLCSAVPAANNYLNLIDQAVSSGQIDAQHALAALDSLDGDFRSAVSGIYKSCNAACVMQMALDAAIATEKDKYTALAQQQAAAAAANVSPQSQPPQAAQPPTAPPAPSSPVVAPARPNVVSAPGAATSSSYSSFYAERAPVAPPVKFPTWLPIAAGIALLLMVRG
jgi:hypothetical protein